MKTNQIIGSLLILAAALLLCLGGNARGVVDWPLIVVAVALGSAGMFKTNKDKGTP